VISEAKLLSLSDSLGLLSKPNYDFISAIQLNVFILSTHRRRDIN
jgi:hypothetical protein